MFVVSLVLRASRRGLAPQVPPAGLSDDPQNVASPRVACLLAGSLVTACSSDSTDPPDPIPSGSSDAASAASATTPFTPVDRDSTWTSSVVPAAATAMPAAWQERFVIAYGHGKELLGHLARRRLRLARHRPRVRCARARTGTWWFLDAAKATARSVRPVGAVPGPGPDPEDDAGRRARTSSGPSRTCWRTARWSRSARVRDGTRLLRLRDGRARRDRRRRGRFAPTYDDGRLLYGFARRGQTGGGGSDRRLHGAHVDLPDAVRDTLLDRAWVVGLKLDLPESGTLEGASRPRRRLALRPMSGSRSAPAWTTCSTCSSWASARTTSRCSWSGATLVSPAGEVRRGRATGRSVQRGRPREPRAAGDGPRLLDTDAGLRPSRRGARLRAVQRLVV